MDRPGESVWIIKVYILIFQVILYDKVPFGISTKCLDYAGILIFKFLH